MWLFERLKWEGNIETECMNVNHGAIVKYQVLTEVNMNIVVFRV
jgi:hypothetical protein